VWDAADRSRQIDVWAYGSGVPDTERSRVR
jgi:hypothetical protein